MKQKTIHDSMDYQAGDLRGPVSIKQPFDKE